MKYLLLALLLMAAPCFADDELSVQMKFVLAVSAGDLALVKTLAKQGVDVNETFALYNEDGQEKAGQEDDDEGNFSYKAITKLKKSGDDWTPLEYAAANGSLEMLKTLVALGASPKEGIPAITAAARGEEDNLRYLASKGSSLATPTGWTALHSAAGSGHLETVKYLVEKQKMKVNAADEEGETPLLYGVLTSFEIVQYLIKKGAKVHPSARQWALGVGHDDIASCLQSLYKDKK